MLWVALFAGLALTAASLWLRADTPRSRWWEHTEGIVDERFAFASIPGAAAIMLGMFVIGAGDLTGIAAVRWGAILVGVALLVAGLGLAFLGFGRAALPRWLVPRWRR